MVLENANPDGRLSGLRPLPGKANYFIGRDPKLWHTGIGTYAEVEYRSVYKGIDLTYYGNQGNLEFDFTVSPGTNPDAIRLRFDPPAAVSTDSAGDLTVRTGKTAFNLLRPNVYQISHANRVRVPARFVFRGSDRTIGVEVASYDHHLPLVIDPAISYSTYIGGTGRDEAYGIAVDGQGDAYIVGYTYSTDFPTDNGYPVSGNANAGVAFVSELNPTGTALLYSTYLGGTGGDWGTGIALDPSGNVYVTGSTFSTDFPVVNAFQSSLGSGNGNAFVARIATTQSGVASLVYSTYLGGGGNKSNWLGDTGFGITADSSGLAYVTGQTASDSSTAPFPTTSTALQSSLASTNGNAFLTVLDTTSSGASSLVYSTYIGGSSGNFGDWGSSIAIDDSGDTYITGETASGSPNPFPTTAGAYQSTLNSQYGNAFVTEIATTQVGSQALVYSTFLGGSSAAGIGDSGEGIAIDASGNIHVVGDAVSPDFPVTAGAYQTANSAAGKAFVAELNPAQAGAESLVYSTFLGGTDGSEGENGVAIAVGANGDAFVAGDSSSSDFPTTPGAPQLSPLSQNSWHAFLSQLDPTGSTLLFSTYYGGSCVATGYPVMGDLGSGAAVDWNGNPYLSGTTCSTDLPISPSDAYQTSLKGTNNAFIAKFALNVNPGIQALASPPPNASGWNNSPVTVSFQCIPGAAPIQTCPSPEQVATEGANQTVSGTVVDTASNTATASDTVNLDMTPPVVTITSPANNSSVATPYVAVSGSVSDALSGVAAVSCNGVPAAISNGSFSCTVQLYLSANTITATAADLAGNASSSSVNVNIGMATPTSIQVTPNPVTVVVGNTQSFAAVDQTGSRRPDATWSVSDTTIATLASDGSGTITAVAPGTVTINATIGTTSGQATVTVISGALAPGTVLWSAPQIPGFTTRNTVQAAPSANGPDLYAIGSDSSGDVLIQALTSDGQQLWQKIVPGGSCCAAAADNTGGVLVYSSSGLADLDGATSNQKWQFTPADTGTLNSPSAVGFDGTVYGEESGCVNASQEDVVNCLDSIDATSGTLKNQIQLPTDVINSACFNRVNPGRATAPVVAPDGQVYVLADSKQQTGTGPQNDCTYTLNETLALLKNGAPYATVATYSQNEGGGFTYSYFFAPLSVIPDGNGGLLISYESWAGGGRAVLTVADTNGASLPLSGFNISYSSWDNMVLGDNNTAFISDGTRVVSFSTTSLQTNWTYTSTNGVSLVAATSDGGIGVNDSQLGFIQLDRNGNASTPVAGFQNDTSPSLGTWLDHSTSALDLLSGPYYDMAAVPFAQPGGDPQNRRTRKATIVTFIPTDPGTPSNGSAQQTKANLATAILQYATANQPVFRINAAATASEFLRMLPERMDAIGFIGHSLDLTAQPPNQPRTYSVGLQFYGPNLQPQSCISSVQDVTCTTGGANATYVTSLKGGARVIFIGSCFVGPEFLSLWNLNTNQALVVPHNPKLGVDLVHAANFWAVLAQHLLGGDDVAHAVRAGNSVMSANGWTERWEIIGDTNVRIP